MTQDCEKCITKACLASGLPQFTSGCSQYSFPPADLARHMAKGQQTFNNTDYDAKIAVIAEDMKNLTSNQLDVIAAFVLAMRRRSWGLSPSPPVDEQPEPEQLGPCASWGPSGSTEGLDCTFNDLCDKDKTNPLPLGSE